MSTHTLRTLLVACCLALGLTVMAGFAGFTVAQAETPADPPPIFMPLALGAPAQNIAVDETGRAWFTLPSVDKLAAVTAEGVITYYPTDAGIMPLGGYPYDVAAEGNNIWFTLLLANQIGKLDTTTNTFTFYPIPTADSEPTGISVGGGYIWFVERQGDKLGRLNPADGTITEFYNWVVDSRNPVDMKDAELEDVAWASDAVWITGPKFKNQVAAYVEVQDRFIPSPAGTGASPMQLFVDGSGNIWVTFTGFGKIGRSAINTLGVWDFYDLPVGSHGPVGLFVSESNNQRRVWYTRPGSDRVGFMVVSFTGRRLGVWETISPISAGAPWGIAANADGVVWGASSASNTSIIWNPPYFTSMFRFPFIRR